MNQLVQQGNEQSMKGKNTGTTPAKPSTESEYLARQSYPTLRSVSHERLSRGRSLTGYLYSILPHPAIVVVILDTGKLFRTPLQIVQSEKSPDTEQSAQAVNILPTAHPVLFARRLIQLALCLLHADLASAEQLKADLNEPVGNAARRYFAAASRLVMSQDYLVSSPDGLETLMLQGRYYITIGDRRTAWFIHRRASNIARSIGLPWLAEATGGRAESMWFQLLYSDRFLSLMLGFPFAIADDSSPNSDQLIYTPAQRLERIHVLIAGRVIARNMRMQRGTNLPAGRAFRYEDYKETKDLDLQLKKATRALPPTWWLVPPLAKGDSDAVVLERTARILVQMHQYLLLVLLHQPYLIQGLSTGSRTGDVVSDSIDHRYSKIAAASASREVLSRYLVLRNHHRSPSSRAMDEKGFTASITLLFAHFDGHRLGNANVLEHQRSHDLGIIEKVIELMEELSSSDGEDPGACCTQILRRLIEMEADAADGSFYRISSGQSNCENVGRQDIAGSYELQLSIPYFDKLHFARQLPQEPLMMGFQDVDLVKMSDILPEVLIPEDRTLTSLPEYAFEPSKGATAMRDPNTAWFNTWIQPERDTEGT